MLLTLADLASREPWSTKIRDSSARAKRVIILGEEKKEIQFSKYIELFKNQKKIKICRIILLKLMSFSLSTNLLERIKKKRLRNLYLMEQNKGLCLSARKEDCLENLELWQSYDREYTRKTERLLNEKIKEHQSTRNFITGE